MKLLDHSIVYEGARVWYVTAGERTNRPLVFLHGAPWGSRCHDVVRELAKYFFVIAPEQPGFGRSDPLSVYTNLPLQYADVLHAILLQEECGAARPIICAQSFGGYAAHGYLTAYRNNISALVLIDAVMPTMPVPRTLRIIAVQGLARWLGGELVAVLPIALTQWILAVLWRKYSLVWDAMIRNPRGVRAMNRHLSSLFFTSLRTRQPIMSVDYSVCSVFLLWGKLDGEEGTLMEGGGITHIRIARALYGKIAAISPRARFVVLEGGHTVLYEDPRYVVGEIQKLIFTH